MLPAPTPVRRIFLFLSTSFLPLSSSLPHLIYPFGRCCTWGPVRSVDSTPSLAWSARFEVPEKPIASSPLTLPLSPPVSPPLPLPPRATPQPALQLGPSLQLPRRAVLPPAERVVQRSYSAKHGEQADKGVGQRQAAIQVSKQQVMGNIIGLSSPLHLFRLTRTPSYQYFSSTTRL